MMITEVDYAVVEIILQYIHSGYGHDDHGHGGYGHDDHDHGGYGHDDHKGHSPGGGYGHHRRISDDSNHPRSSYVDSYSSTLSKLMKNIPKYPKYPSSESVPSYIPSSSSSYDRSEQYHPYSSGSSFEARPHRDYPQSTNYDNHYKSPVPAMEDYSQISFDDSSSQGGVMGGMHEVDFI